MAQKELNRAEESSAFEKTIRKSESKISSQVGSDLALHNKITGTTIMINEQMYQHLQSPEAQAALLDRLRKDNPGYSFTIKNLVPTLDMGKLGVPGVQIGVNRSLDDVEEAKELEKKIKTSESEISSEIAGLAHHKINGA
ncbi:MAG: hypothetical protein NTY68_02270, partial [Candidatus Micrarchaeota archaeon]|nr:hypothetical protein [Candidatus Micrarchaeota archaeon]